MRCSPILSQAGFHVRGRSTVCTPCLPVLYTWLLLHSTSTVLRLTGVSERPEASFGTT